MLPGIGGAASAGDASTSIKSNKVSVFRKGCGLDYSACNRLRISDNRDRAELDVLAAGAAVAIELGVHDLFETRRFHGRSVTGL